MPARQLPIFLRKIDDNRLGSASDDEPTERRVLRPVDFAVNEPSRHMYKIPRARQSRMFSPLAPLNVRFAFQNVCNCFLQAVMMDPRLRSGLDKKSSAPQR